MASTGQLWTDMLVLVLNAVPQGVRGDLTKWLMEIAPGVYIGRPSATVRDRLWNRVCRHVDDGDALMAFSAANDQGFEFRTNGHKWEPTDFDGLTLMMRPQTIMKDEHTHSTPRYS